MEKIADALVSGKLDGVFLPVPEKVGRVAPIVAEALFNRRAKGELFFETEEGFRNEIAKCTQCMNCVFTCPHSLRVDRGMAHAQKTGDVSKLAELEELCIACGKCEQACPKNIKIINVIMRSNLDCTAKLENWKDKSW